MNKKTALITGASSGIGASFARLLAGEGYELWLTGRRKEKLAALKASLPDETQVEIILGDLSQERHIAELEKKIRKEKPAVLINNAGYGDDIIFEDTEIAYHQAMLKVHVEASLRLAHACIAGMKDQREGVILNVSSISGLIPTGGTVSYNATKAYLVMMSRSLAINLRRENIKVSALCPGLTHTDFHTKMGMDEADKLKWSRNWMPADKVVKKGWKAALKGKPVFIPGFRNRLMVGFVNLLPRRVFEWLAYKIYTQHKK